MFRRFLVSAMVLVWFSVGFAAAQDLSPNDPRNQPTYSRSGAPAPAPLSTTRAAGIQALTLTVNTATDTPDANAADGLCADAQGICSLRAAVMQANSAAPGSVITLPPGRYNLAVQGLNEDLAAAGDLDIRQTMTINGGGAGQTVINAGGIDRVFEVRTENVVFTLNAVTVSGGSAITEPATGGGLWVGVNSQAYLTDATVSGNTATFGGGLQVETGGFASLTRSAVVRNITGNSGGGIDVFNADLLLTAVTISSNTTAGNGGGAQVASTTGGSALFDAVHVTVAANRGGQSGAGIGGGIYVDPIGGAETVAELKRVLIAENTAPSSPDCAGTFTATGARNLVTNISGCSLPDNPIVAPQPGIQPLAVNAPGQTPTHAITFSSPARNAGNTANCETGGAETAQQDQRGITMPQEPNCDIGAYEYTLDLIVNGGFEVPVVENPALPAGWNAQSLKPSDRVKCNKINRPNGKPDKIFALGDNCAFRFKGLRGTNNRLIQKPELNFVNPNRTLNLTAHVTGSEVKGKAFIQVVVRYTNGVKLKLEIQVPKGTYPYQKLTDSALITAPVEKIKTKLINTTKKGKWSVDVMSMTVEGTQQLLPPLNTINTVDTGAFSGQ